MKKRTLRILTITLLVLGVLFISLVVLVRYLFPNETVRQELEARLSEQLKGSVRIQSLVFDPLSGLRVGPVEVKKNQKRLVHLDGLTLQYDLWHLLRGKLVINEVVLDGADVSLNLADFQPVAPDAASPLPPSSSAEVPVVPLALDLQSFQIKDSNVRVTNGSSFAAALKGVNLEAALSVGLGKAELSGTLTVDQAGARVEDKTLRLPLSLEFALSANLASESIEIQSLSFRSDPAIRLSLSGQVDKFLTEKAVHFSLKDARIDLEQIFLLARDFVPPEVQGAQVRGTLSPALTIQGELGDAGFNGVVRAQVEGQDVQIVFPAFDLALQPIAFTLQTSGIVVKENVPESVSAELALTTQWAEFQAYSAKEVQLALTGEYSASGEFAGKVRLQGQISTPPLGPLAPVTRPFEVELDSAGNLKELALTLNKVMLKVGSLVKLVARGNVSAPRPGDGVRELRLTAEVEARLGRLISLLPRDQVRGLILAKGGGPGFVTVAGKGKVGSDFKPRQAELTGRVRLAGIRAVIKEVGAQGWLDKLDLSLKGTYQATNHSLRGTVSGAVVLSELKYGQMVEIGKTTLTLGSTLHGEVSDDLQLSKLASRDTVTAAIRNLHYRHGAVSAGLKGLVLSSRTRADLVGGVYWVDQLRVSSGSLFEVLAKGWYRANGRRFSLEVSAPSFSLGPLLTHVSGEAIEPVREINPAGVISVRLKGSGTVPDPRGRDLLSLPITLVGQLKLHGVKGAFQGNQVVGANGTVEISYHPEKQNRFEASTTFRATSVELSPEFPLKRASGIFADLQVTAEQFDQVKIQNLHVGVDGGDFSLEGELTGVRGLLETGGKHPGSFLGPLFIHLRSKAAVDVGRFPELLKTYGIEGSGRAEVALSVLKKEHGPIDVRLRLDNRQVNIAREAIRLVNLNGGLAIRKVLGWIPGLNGSAPPQIFSPSALLPQLRSYSPTQRALNIEKVDFAGLTITELSGAVKFDQNRLLVQNLAMNLLGGGLGGNLVLTSGKAFGVTTRLEAAQLDLNELLEPGRKIPGDGTVDGVIDLTAFFDGEKGNLNLAQTEMELYITRIGRDALDRLLLFLDPDGSNPSIVGARSAVRLANPSTVRVTLRKGSMSLQITFQEGLLSSFQMDRIPVGKIKNLRNVTRTIPQWATVREVMSLLGKDQYGVDTEGKLILQ